jgi:hypothetical protein
MVQIILRHFDRSGDSLNVSDRNQQEIPPDLPIGDGLADDRAQNEKKPRLRISGEHRPLACSCRQLAGNILVRGDH